MVGSRFLDNINVILLLGLILVGGGIGLWNQQQVQECHAEYDDDPSIAVDCEDAFSSGVNVLSALCIGGGIIGLISVLYRRRG